MRVQVTAVSIPAFSSIAEITGTDDDGNEIVFAGDHRPSRDLGEALAVADEPIEVEIEEWQIIRRVSA